MKRLAVLYVVLSFCGLPRLQQRTLPYLSATAVEETLYGQAGLAH